MYGACGSRNTLSVGPLSTTRPSFITMIAVGHGADDGEVVADEEIGQADARPAGRRSSSTICFCTERSRAEVGSSSTTSCGLEDHGAGDGDALALAAGELVRVAVARGGIEPDLLERPGGARVALARVSAGSWTSRPSVTISPTVRRGESEPNGSWKTTCSSRRSGRSVARRGARESRPAKRDACPGSG